MTLLDELTLVHLQSTTRSRSDIKLANSEQKVDFIILFATLIRDETYCSN